MNNSNNKHYLPMILSKNPNYIGSYSDNFNITIDAISDSKDYRLLLPKNNKTGFLYNNGLGRTKWKSSTTTSEFTDLDFYIYNNNDNSKKINFDSSDISSSTTRTITMPDSNVDLNNSIPSYGAQYSTANTINIGDTTNYYFINNVNGGLISSDVVLDNINGSITINKTGVYYVSVSTSFSGSSNNEIYGNLFRNIAASNSSGTTGYIVNVAFNRKLGTGGDVGSTDASGIISVTSGDYFKFGFRNITGDNNIICSNYSINIMKLS